MPLTPSDLATIKTTDDGELEVTLQRFGRLTVKLENGQTLEIYVRRDGDKKFGCFVTSDVDPTNEKGVEKLKKLNSGKVPHATMRLHADGVLYAETESEDKKTRRAATGKGAAAADAKAGETPAGESGKENEPKI